MTVYNVQDFSPFQYLGCYCNEDRSQAERELSRLRTLAPAGDWRIVKTVYPR